MSQTATKENYDPFEDDDVDDDELCRVNWFISFFLLCYTMHICQACDELDNDVQRSQSQQCDTNNVDSTDNSTQNSIGGLKRKRLGVSTTPNERRAIIRKQ